MPRRSNFRRLGKLGCTLAYSLVSCWASAQDITTGLVGHWKLDEAAGTTAADSSGNANHGTLYGGLAFGTDSIVPAQVDDGLDFDGADDYVSVPNHTTLQFTTSLTTAAWIKADGWGSGSEVDVILRKGEGNPNNWQFAIADGRATLYLDDNDGNGIRGDTVLNTGQWYHVAATWNGSEVRVYVNGVLDHTPVARSGTIGTDTRPVYLGGRSGADLFDGGLDDVRAYNRALAAADVLALYRLGDVLVGHWAFDEGSGTQVADGSNFQADASFNTGTPTWTGGVKSGGLQFDGASDADTDAAFDPPGIGTVAFWFRGNGAPPSRQRLFGLSTAWEVRYETSGALVFDLSIDTGFSSGTTFTEPDRWHHLAAVYNSDTDAYTLYIDGQFATSGSMALADQAAALLSFGTRTGSSERFAGALDDLRVYNYELTATEIADLYGLVGHWKFDEGTGGTAGDSTAYANAATLSGAAWTTTCAGENGLEFDGAGDTAATGSVFDPPESGSVAFWMRSAGLPAARSRIFGLGGDWEIRQETDGTISCDLGADAGVTFVTSASLGDVDRWYHVVAIYNADDESFEIYIDGELNASGTNADPIDKQSANTLTFGTRTGNTEYWEGGLRDFRVFNRPLIHQEIAALSENLGYWKLDETSGVVAADASVNANDGAYVNGPTLGVSSVFAPANATAVSFDGVNDYVEIPHAPPMLADEGAVAFWFRTNQFMATQGLFSKDSNGYDTGGHLTLSLVSGKVNAQLQSTSQSYAIEASSPNGSRWTHVVLVWGLNGMVLYLDGREAASDLSYTGGLGTSSGGSGNHEPIVLGADAAISGNLSATPLQNYLSGAMDDVRFYSRIVCPEEVYRIYRGGRSPGVRIIRWLEVR